MNVIVNVIVIVNVNVIVIVNVIVNVDLGVDVVVVLNVARSPGRELTRSRSSPRSRHSDGSPPPHSPIDATSMPADAALHALPYVRPSQPQTGS